MLLSFLRQRLRATEEVALKLRTHAAAELSEERSQRVKLNQTAARSWENQVSRRLRAVGCVFLQCPCLLLCSESAAKALVAFLREGCFHLCMAWPGRSFLSDTGLD